MVRIDIPGLGQLSLQNLVLDFNGTLALDGSLLPGLEEKINSLSERLNVYVLTADTFGNALQACGKLNVRFKSLTKTAGTSTEKLDFLQDLDPACTVAIGNGNNDGLMIKEAALGIAVLGPEGSCARSIMNADVVVTDIDHALDLLLQPLRLIATLRD